MTNTFHELAVIVTPEEIELLAAAISYGDSFTTDWVENEGKSDPDALAAAETVERAGKIVDRIAQGLTVGAASRASLAADVLAIDRDDDGDAMLSAEGLDALQAKARQLAEPLTDAQRVDRALALLAEARDLVKAAGNRRTADRIRAATFGECHECGRVA